MRQKILDAACTVFLSDGFAFNLRDVSKLAGVSRQTVYRYFTNRDLLLGAAIEALIPDPSPGIFGTVPQDDPASVIRAFSRHYFDDALSERGVALYRVIVGPKRDPEQGQSIFKAIHASLLNDVADFLHRNFADTVRDRAHAERIGERFLGALMGYSRFRSIFGVEEDAEQRRLMTEEAVEALLRELDAAPLLSEQAVRP